MKNIIVTMALSALSIGAFAGAPRPSEAQMKYFEADVIGIVHYGLNTYVDKEWGYGDTPTSVFQPTNLDPEQWVVAAKAGGLKRLVLVCKHHDGFCLFPSKLNDDYTVANTPWKGGKGDLVREFRDACAKHGMEFGAYLSPWDRHQANYATSAYADYFLGQWEEIMSDYGPISEIWLDGANGGDGWYGGAKETRKLPSDARTYYRFNELLDKLERRYPLAIAFGGGSRANCAAWCGNEKGENAETCWNVRDGMYVPNEADTPFRRRGWFWHPDDSPKSLAELVDVYFMTVGRNSVLDLGLAPNRDGLISADDVARLKEFGDYIRALNATDFAANAQRADVREGGRLVVNVKLASSQNFNVVDIKEDISGGQVIAKWTAEARVGGEWKRLASGTTIGYRRMERFPPVMTGEVRVVLEGEMGRQPKLNSLALRFAPPVVSEVEAPDFEQWRSPVKLTEPSPDVRIYDFLRRVAIDAFRCHPPQDRTDGVPDKFAVYASDDGENWREVMTGEFGNLRANPVAQTASLPGKIETRFVKIAALHALDGTPRWEGSLTEFFRRKPKAAAPGAKSPCGAAGKTACPKPEELVECPVSDNLRGHENVEWSKAYAFSLTDDKRDLPRVFLIGDSICNGYKDEVKRLLEGKMTLSYWISSYCVTSPGYLKLLDFYLSEAKYDVIHFNNGLHSLGTPIAAYKNGVRAAMELIRRRQPQAKIVWCSSTPLKDAAKTAKCRELNAAAAQVVAELGGIATDDLFALLDPFDREENWADVYHHKPPLCAKEAEQVADSVAAVPLCLADREVKVEKSLKVLMIGNSFSICNLEEMPNVAASMGLGLDLASLYIGGCSLERHWNNVVAASTNAVFRPYRFDRTTDGKKVVEKGEANIPDALVLDKWDVVTIQQASHFSWQLETFEPFGGLLVEKIRKLAPQAKIVVQETWSYPPWDGRLKRFGFDQAEMYKRLHAAYAAFARNYGFEVIPVGTAAEFVHNRNSLFTEPDFHFNREGVYLQGLAFTAKFFGVNVRKCPYKPDWMDAARAEEIKASVMDAEVDKSR